jgi:hypothetical protein
MSWRAIGLPRPYNRLADPHLLHILLLLVVFLLFILILLLLVLRVGAPTAIESITCKQFFRFSYDLFQVALKPGALGSGSSCKSL